MRMRLALVAAVLFVAACGGPAAVGPGVPVPDADVPDALTFTLADVTPADSPVRVVRTIRCEVVSPHDIFMMELRWPGIELPDGWESLSSALPFEHRDVTVRRATRYAWTVDIQRRSADAPTTGDVSMSFRFDEPGGGPRCEIPSNVVHLEFPPDAQPHALDEADVLRAADEGFLLRVSERGGFGAGRFIELRPDGSFRALENGPDREIVDRTGMLDATARAEIAALLHRIEIWELLHAVSDAYEPRPGATRVTVVLAVGDGCARRVVLGSNMRASPEWVSLTKLLAERTGVSVPAR